ncbi:MAG: sirohydrochlorin chelatase [Rhodospirillales bacterium]|nr:sirohydrochlorin chelatase [Rhodospirillales bacterium]
MTTSTGIIICGHGSRSVAAVEEFRHLVGRLRERLPEHDVEFGFLEFARPVIRDGLEALKARGAQRIICLPGMLFAAGHVKNDLPSEINTFAAENPGIEVCFGRELAIDPKLLRASAARIAAAEAAAERQIPRAETLLLVVGRGTNDSDANSNVSKVARMLWEGMGFGWTEVGYSGVAHPLTDAALDHAARLGYRRIIVFPYFLFTGILVDRIYAAADACRQQQPQIDVVKADYLNDHPLVIETFLARLEEAIDGTGVMNCLLCKYREQVLGYEKDQGAAQAGHHHHVRGIGTDADHAHDHHGHEHAHDHHGHHHHGHDHHGHHHGAHDHDHAHAHPHPHGGNGQDRTGG